MPEVVSGSKPTGFNVVGLVLNVGDTDVRFSELAGISSEMELIEYREGGAASVTDVKWMPGRRKPPTLVLRRPLSGDEFLAAWHQAAVAGDVTKAGRDAELRMLGAEGKLLTRYALERAWPTKLEVTSSGSAALVESVTLTCERLERLGP